jgi:hypothetical protein
LADDNSIALLLQRGVDFQVFCEEVLGLRLNHAQKRLLPVLRVDAEWREWAFKELVVVAANQIGKTLIQAAIMLWACQYKIGVDPHDEKAWERAPYLWIHLGPVQQQAYHAYKDMNLMIKGEHPAQGNRSQFPEGLVHKTKIENYYDGFQFFNGAQIMFRTAEHKAEAVLGYKAAAISVDEAAFVDYLTEVKNTVLMMRLIASGGPLMLFSTPNGMNDFFDQADIIRENGEEISEMLWRDGTSYLAWAIITDNLGFGIDQKEIDRMEKNLSPTTKEQQLRGAFLEPAEAFFVPQDKIVRAFRADMPHETPPVPGHKYAIFYDPSVASDPTACVVLDCTEYPWRGVYFGHWEKPMDVTALIGEMFRVHQHYNGHMDKNFLSVPSRAVLGFDATSMGGAVMKQLLAPITPKKGINMAGAPTKKVAALTNLRDRLTNGQIILPASWLRLRQEILNYRLKDKGIKQDAAMALMGADMVATSMNPRMQQKPIQPHARITPRRELRWQ